MVALQPLVDELTDGIVRTAQETAFAKSPSGKGLWKKNIPLNKDELNRQAYMIDLYLERDQLSLAVGLMREWVVSWAIWRSGKIKEIEKWLDHDVRVAYEHRLGAVGAAAKSSIAPPVGTPIWGINRFGNFWNQLTDNLRNALLHNAMRTQHVEQPPSSLNAVRKFWNVLKIV